MDRLTKAQRSRNMRAIKSKDTKMEVKLAKALWAKGYRYRKNDRTVFGKPDITFKKYKIAVFVDSEFFHGKNWNTEKFRIKSNREFWWKKIEANISRDNIVNDTLVNKDWVILRFWSQEIKKELELCVLRIEEAIRNA